FNFNASLPAFIICYCITIVNDLCYVFCLSAFLELFMIGDTDFSFDHFSGFFRQWCKSKCSVTIPPLFLRNKRKSDFHISLFLGNQDSIHRITSKVNCRHCLVIPISLCNGFNIYACNLHGISYLLVFLAGPFAAHSFAAYTLVVLTQLFLSPIPL